MRTRYLLALIATAATAGAQRPDFTGTWAYQSGQAALTLPASPSAVMGARFSIVVDDAKVTMTTLSGDASLVSSLPLDGTRTAMSVPGRLCEGERQVYRTARWDKNALVITTVGSTPAGGGPTTDANVPLTLRMDGDRLVVEATIARPGQRQQVGAVYAHTTDAMPAPGAPDPIAGTPATISDVSWIAGEWTGRSANGAVTEELWSTPASGGMISYARTMRDAALSSFEFLCIAERSGSLAYLAMPNGHAPATVFMLTSVTPTSAQFENPSHDFPKMIRYRLLPNGSLETVVAAANNVITQVVYLQKRR